ncbi:MAG: AMP-binding protein [Rhizobium sp.]|nr:AMP-binding protein [Rhizobium sp.]
MKTTRWTFPVRGEEDIRALETRPYDELVPSRSIYQLFEANAELHGDRPAITVLANPDPASVSASYTHSQFLGEITRVANLLSDLGGDVPTIAILARNYAMLPAIIWGGQTAGVISCLNYLLTSDVIRQLLAAERATVLIVPGPALDTELWNKLAPILSGLDEIRHVMVLGGLPQGQQDPRLVDFDAELALQPSSHLLRPRVIDRDTIGSILHTGGTTGLPKLVPQTHGNQIHAAWSFGQMFSIDETDVIINGMPMFHVGGTITFQLTVLAAAGHMILTAPAGFRDPAVVANYWATVDRFRVTMAGGVPTTIAAIADVPVGDNDISSLRMALTGGAILPSTVAARFEQRAGIPLLEQYGMTETMANIATTPFHGDKRRGSVGYRAPFGGIRIGPTTPDDGKGDGAAPGVIGPVSCRGPNVFPGYLSARHREGLFIGDGWMSTGDIGFLTPKGQLVLTGREKDLIIRSAHNIDPAVIEEVANGHPDVSLSAAVGMPDAYAGEVPVIFVEPVKDRQVDPVDLLRYITERVPEPPAKPRQVIVIAEIPKTGVGKIFKPALREQAIRRKIDDVLAGIDPAATAEIVIDMVSGKVPEVRITLADTRTRARLLSELRDLHLDIRTD